MLEHPSIRWYSLPKVARTRSSDNPSGADNQQETVNGILRDCTPGTPVERHDRSDVKVQSDPHGDMGSQAEMTWPRRGSQP